MIHHTFKQTMPLFLIILIPTTLLLVNGCRKQNENYSSFENKFTDEVRKYLQKEVLNSTKDVILRNDSRPSIQNAGHTPPRILQLCAKLDWSQAILGHVTDLPILVIPISEPVKTFKNKSSQARRAVSFYKDRTGGINMNFIEVIGDQGAVPKIPVQEIGYKSILKMVFKKKVDFQGQNCSVLLYNKDYGYTNSLGLKGGEQQKQKIRIINKKGGKTRRVVAKTMASLSTCQICTTWTTVGYWYDIDSGEILDYEILDSWDECTDINPKNDCSECITYYGENQEEEDACSYTEQDAQDILSSMHLTESDQTTSTTGLYEENSVDGKIRAPVNIGWHFLTLTLLNIRFEYSADYAGIKYKDAVDNTKWKWETFQYNGFRRLTGDVPPCIALQEKVNPGALMVWSDNSLARHSLNYSFVGYVTCIGNFSISKPIANTISRNFDPNKD